MRYIRNREGLTLGELRNLACDASRGDIIIHWDDDDWSARWRVRYQLEELAAAPEASLCGLASVIFTNQPQTHAWLYQYPYAERRWIAGGTLCYHRSFWRAHQFQSTNEGEDTHFVWTAAPEQLHACEVNTFYVAQVHDRNTSPKVVDGPLWSPYPLEKVKVLMQNG